MHTTLRKQILVVDDEPGVLLLLQHFLGEAFDVSTAENGRRAFDWLNAGNLPHLVLTDIEMPEMDGYELLRRLRADAAFVDVRCWMVSGKNKNLHYLRAMRLGADGFIAKPFTAAEINRKLMLFSETTH